MNDQLGRLEPVPLRQVWPHEGNDFTPWLAQQENLALLAETLQLGDLSEQRTEVSVGSFYIDILAKDELGNAVVIENQFGPTDHTHLGQIMTYLAGQESHVTVVWVAETFREEHRAAIDWLNASTIEGFDFFAVEVEASKIGASVPAPRFNVVSKPNNWSRSVSRATRAGSEGPLDERQKEYVANWSDFDAFLNAQSAPFRVSGSPRDYGCSFGLGLAGVSLLALAGKWDNRLAVELRLNSKASSKALFDQLRQQQTAIEADIGEPLEWLRQDDKIRSRIAISTKAFNVSDREQWPKQYGWLLDHLLKFKAAFQERVRGLGEPDVAPEPDAAS